MSKKLFKVLVFILFIPLLFFYNPKQSFASENFTTKYAVVYSVDESSLTHATFSITLTNTTDQFYASSYKVRLGFDSISSVKASDDAGNMEPEIINDNEGQTLSFNFNKRVTGKGNSLHFNLSFDTPDVAKQNGNVWEINIPGIKNKEDFSTFSATVKVPESFGQPSYIKPVQLDNSLTFSKEQLETSGISIAFGNIQTYKFNLTYHISNTNVFPVKTEIALPPTTNYQKVSIDSIIPAPTNITQTPA